MSPATLYMRRQSLAEREKSTEEDTDQKLVVERLLRPSRDVHAETKVGK